MNSETQQFATFGAAFTLFFLFIGLLITVLMAWVYCKIFSKAGYPWALGLLMFVPIANRQYYNAVRTGFWRLAGSPGIKTIKTTIAAGSLKLTKI